jgi:hypothetical protein
MDFPCTNKKMDKRKAPGVPYVEKTKEISSQMDASGQVSEIQAFLFFNRTAPSLSLLYIWVSGQNEKRVS